MTAAPRRLAPGLALVLALAVAAIPPTKAAEPTSLVDHGGHGVAWSDFAGRRLLVYFGYTYCPDLCPTALADMTAALEALGPDAVALQPLFVSLDPARDTPAVLADYVAHFDPRFIGLTGTPEAIAALAARYRVAFEKRPADAGGDYLIDHASKLMLIGPEGEIRASFLHGIRPEQLARALRRKLAAP